MLKSICLAATLLASGYALGQTAVKLSDKFQKKLEAADTAYQQALTKAENAKFYAVQKATADRVKVLKQALSEATKSGDLETANEIKARIESAEKAGGTRAKPKDTVKFGGHEYALIETKATWHVAKRICEEMGGHLATIENPAEGEGLLEMARNSKQSVWLGASDEEQEGEWTWVTVAPVKIEFRQDNHGDAEHYLGYYVDAGTWSDMGDGRVVFICEWDK